MCGVCKVTVDGLHKVNKRRKESKVKMGTDVHTGSESRDRV